MYTFSKSKFKKETGMTDDEIPDWVWRLNDKVVCDIHGESDNEYGIVDNLYHVSIKWCDSI